MFQQKRCDSSFCSVFRNVFLCLVDEKMKEIGL